MNKDQRPRRIPSIIARFGACFSVAGLVLLMGPVACRGPSGSVTLPDPPATPGDPRTENRLADLNALVEGLASNHADPFFRLRREEFFAAAAALQARADELNESQWLVGLHRLVAMIGDAHTRLTIVAGKPPCQTSVPIRITGLADGYFVEAAPTGHLGLLGARVVAIGEVPIEEVVRRLREFMPSETDTNAREVAAVYMKYDEVLHCLGVIPIPGNVSYTVMGGAEAAGETPRIATIPSIRDESPWSGAVLPDPKKTPLPIGRTSRAEQYWHMYLPQAEVLYCRYDRCADGPGQTVADWTRQAADELKKQAPRAVVVDLRRNPGGNSGLLLPLVSHLRTWKNADPSRAVYALVGPATFSSGVTNAINLKEYAGAKLVGEQPGQAIGSFGEVRRFRLPRSGLEVTYGSVVRDDPRHPIPLLPDIAAPMTAAEFFAGRDPAMQAVTAIR